MAKHRKPIGSFGNLGERRWRALEDGVAALTSEARGKAGSAPFDADRFDADLEKSLNQLYDEGATPEEAARKLAVAYWAHQGSMSRGVVAGWLVLVSMVQLSDGGERWHASASLYPMGRSSTEEDWRVLGRIVAASGATGEDAMGQIREQVEWGTAPNAPHHWLWRVEPSVKLRLVPEPREG